MKKPPHTRTAFTRRQTLAAMGAAGAAAVLGRRLPFAGGRGAAEVAEAAEPATAAAVSCVLAPSLTEGPYFVDELLNRSNITGGVVGVPLTLTLGIYDVSSGACNPYSGAVVDVWHAAPNGTYSDEAANGTTGQTYLRGLQVSDSDGLVKFTTLFPGWYSGRAIHIHVKIRVFSGTTKTYEFNTQLFFDPTLENSVVASHSQYNSRGATPDVPNSGDMIYAQSGGKTIVPLTASGSGYKGAISLGLSGLPSESSGGGTGDAKVSAKLSKARFRRTAGGSRVLRLRIKGSEGVTANARLLRGSEVIAHKRKHYASGTHTLKVVVPRRVHRGRARLKLTLKDSSGNIKTVRKKVRVPRRLTRA